MEEQATNKNYKFYGLPSALLQKQRSTSAYL